MKQEEAASYGWVKGEAKCFWMEENIPSGLYDNYIFDSQNNKLTFEHFSVIHFLHKLKVILDTQFLASLLTQINTQLR